MTVIVVLLGLLLLLVCFGVLVITHDNKVKRRATIAQRLRS